MKRYSDYTTPVRAEALKRLRERDGILCWGQTFDTSAPVVLAECEAVDQEQRTNGLIEH